jgi:hypothetical protein
VSSASPDLIGYDLLLGDEPMHKPTRDMEYIGNFGDCQGFGVEHVNLMSI